MADSDKNILITPNRGQANEPKIEFVGSSSLPITLKVLDDNSLSWEGSEGQLFSITNNLSTGTIFSVNDISGVPSIEVDADGTVVLAEFSGNVGVGTASPSHKLTVSGTLSASVGLFDSITGSLAGTATTALTASNVNILSADDDNNSYKVVFASDFEGSLRVKGDEDGFNYNPFTNTLSNVTLNGTATQVSQTLTRGSYLTGNNYNGSAATTWAVDATSANTASKVVARDGSGNFSAGTITATAVRSGNGLVSDPAFAPSSDTNTGIFFPTTHTIAFSKGGAEAMRIDSNGDVGINITNPEDKLHVNGPIRVTGIGSGTALRVEGGNSDPVLLRTSITPDNDSGDYGFSIKYMGSRIGNSNSLSIFSDNQGAPTQIEVFTILQDGKIGIGTIEPNYTLAVTGTLGVSGNTTLGSLTVDTDTNTPYLNISIARGSTINGFFNSTTTQTILASVGRNLTLGAWSDVITPPSNSITITSEGRMGIGETSPAAPLTVDGDNATKYAAILNDNNADGVVVIKGSTDDSLFITNAASDKVGIGLLPESYKFQVSGSNATAGTICAGFGDGIQVGNTYIGRWATNSSYAGIYHTNQRTNGSSYSLIAASDGQTFINSAALKSLNFRINNIDAMIINSSRKVGINDTNPSYELDVSGTINASFRYRIGDQAAIYLTGTEVQVGSANQNIFHSLSLCAGGQTGRLFIDTAGKVGIGTTSPGYKLDVNGSIRLDADLTANGNGTGLIFKTDNSSIFWGMGVSTNNSRLYFQYTGSANVAYIQASPIVGALDFTGQHRSLPKNGAIEDYESKVGLIVASSGDYQKIEINEALPFVELSNSRNQKNVYGVISNIEDPNSNTREYVMGAFGTSTEKQENDNRLIINSLGEGGIWITNINGNLENGDYITTCEIPGYGMKQDDDLLHNYTVAKITCDCDFDLQSPIYICEEFQWEGQTYRKAFVGCTYHCG